MSAATQKVTLMCDGKAYTIEVVDPATKKCITASENGANGSSVMVEDSLEDKTDMETQQMTASSRLEDSEAASALAVNLDSQSALPIIVSSASTSFTNGMESVSDDVRWTRELTLLLITERGKRNQLFETPRMRKNKLWDIIAKKINTFSQVPYTGANCWDKWRGLLQRYRLIKSKKKDPRHRPITWEYFDSLDLILGYKPVVQSPPLRARPLVHTVRSTQDRFPHRRPKLHSSRFVKRTPSMREQDLLIDTPAVSNSSNASNDFTSVLGSTRNGKVVEDPPWLKKYLIHREEEEDRRTLREELQCEEERKRWSERKELEERKIAVMNELNKSICLLLEKLK